ncbi:MAG: glycosyltransferase family 2 protein [Sphingomonadales bacterium]|nr:glycosyltransferase family 2 protein [Sphingomonadales bacterium]
MDGEAVSEDWCEAVAAPDVSLIMPCLNERDSLPHCIANARSALAEIERHYGLSGEIVIADNGSTDGSQALAAGLGARVAPVAKRGYGAALIGGCEAARGRYLLMADADGSYDFRDGVAMIGRLIDGAELVMGSRFQGGIAKGAMPWKNRYIGNPALTGVLNLFFRSGIDDAHCGIRAISKQAFLECSLSASGMEFASEMVVKASLRDMRIDQVPATLSLDLRDRAPHLRPWRDGWRHLRYLLMLSPTWVFGVPALMAMLAALSIFSVAALFELRLLSGTTPFGTSWQILAGFLLSTGHFALLMALATHLYGVHNGYRRLRPTIARWGHVVTLEHALALGSVLVVGAVLVLGVIGIRWSAGGFVALPSVLPLTMALAIGAVGAQTALGGFVLAIIAGHDADLLGAARQTPAPAVPDPD